MKEFVLQFLNAPLLGLYLGEVADKADEHRHAFDFGFAGCKLQGEGRAVLPLTGDNAADRNDAPLAVF